MVSFGIQTLTEADVGIRDIGRLAASRVRNAAGKTALEYLIIVILIILIIAMIARGLSHMPAHR